jgi:hypothetical protein
MPGCLRCRAPQRRQNGPNLTQLQDWRMPQLGRYASSSRSEYVRQRPDDTHRLGAQYSLTDQWRVPCTSVAFLEPFWSLLSSSILYEEREAPRTDDNGGD